jgi:hypothetical protein
VRIKCCVKGFAFQGMVPAQSLFSGFDACAQRATAAYICWISSNGRAVAL